MARPTVAVVGAGVSGLMAAYILQGTHDVTIFEARNRLGGNADTRDFALMADGGTVPVDVGFILFNDEYRNLNRLFDELGVERRPASISIDVVCSDCGFHDLNSRDPFGRSALVRPDAIEPLLWSRFDADLARFPTDVLAAMDSDRDRLTVGEFIETMGYTEYFFQHFLYPRSVPFFLMNSDDLRRTPLEFMVQTLSRYQAIGPDGFANWFCVVGGSRVYVDKIARRCHAVNTDCPITEIRRQPDMINLRDGFGATHRFDKAVVATEAATALTILADASIRERAILGAFRYTQPDLAWHTDLSVLRSAGRDDHSAIRMTLSCKDHESEIKGLSIDLNMLENIDTPTPVVCTFNDDDVDPDAVLGRSSFQHPVFDRRAVQARSLLAELGDDRLAFAGSYHGDGFHESGCESGVAAARKLGAVW
ncbi:FAD-dependent oxidoreductase [Nocardia sp. NBC_00565]|uniref:FAD-dependent oxidoreductase n=1 Tax=Nocardia sp. NBC_00565 TaxID=2975993 RepID=UPI002E81377B|nr:FAD-dependent oxidoreductase [Nocardia sp. NBC_00565]WUC07479.1 FAD-dependent oxidoreductase [Nocardia sp. NBC_00565]